MTSEQLAARLRAAFLAELEEQTRVMNADLLALERTPSDSERLKSLFRVAHTLKGAARAANVRLVEQVCHELESMLVKARGGTLTLEPSQFALLFAAADALSDAHGRLGRSGHLEGSPLVDVLQGLTGKRQQPVRPQSRGKAAEVAVPSSADRTDMAQVRVDALKLDAVLAAAADLRQAKSRVGTRFEDLRAIEELAADVAARWRSAARRVRARLGGGNGNDAADALRALDDMDDRLRTLVRETGRSASGAARDHRGLSQTVDEVSDGVVRLRMRPFAEICEALPRLVRDLAGEEGKRATLLIEGGGVEADRGVLDALREPLAHLVKNAIGHGIEKPGRREAAGKPSHGTVTCTASLRGDRFVVTVSDDGAGMDIGELRMQLQRAGKVAPEDDIGVARAAFESGVSTVREASVLAGRGVGLDLVRATVERIGGAVDIEWKAGRGTTFTLECPLTMASIRVVLVGLGAHTVAIPTSSVERLLRVHATDIKRAEGRDVLAGSEGERPVPLVSLARLLGPPYVERAVADAAPAVRMNVGGKRLAAVVDSLIDECDVTVRPLSHRGQLPLLSGAAMIVTGGVAPVLNGAAIVAEGLRVTVAGQVSLRSAPAEESPPRRILVVDDSITTRTLEQSVLEAAGYEVLTAVDGAEAWRALQEKECDLVVSDVEMPRMDGFELCQAIRASKRFAKLPVVLVTALETEEQRARGLEAGADAYLGKSTFDQQTLLDVIRQFLE